MPLGRQILCDMWGCEGLEDADLAESALQEATRAGKATLIRSFVHRFSPHGVTALALIAESHVALHTWPEYGYASVDIFTCGEADPEAVLEYLIETYRPRQVQRLTLERGPLRVETESEDQRLAWLTDGSRTATGNAQPGRPDRQTW
jgi:S-adenosylmethionine decarboxylase proenzyme